MQICEQNIDKLQEDFKACMNNKELILLYACLATGAPTAVQAFIQQNFPTYAQGIFIDSSNTIPDDCDTLYYSLQTMLIEQGFITAPEQGEP